MISLQEFVSNLVSKIEDAGMSYMIAGSLASSILGKPRTTNDVDIVIAPNVDQLKKFIQSFTDEHYVDAAAAQEALRTQTMFNVIDPQSGWKVDFVVLKQRAYSQTEFQRRQQNNFSGIRVFVASPEDVILSKLERSKESESERQFQDALGVAVVQWDRLDKVYLRKWAVELGISHLLEKLLEQAQVQS
jgi:uncharacterized protein (DUF1330 family)